MRPIAASLLLALGVSAVAVAQSDRNCGAYKAMLSTIERERPTLSAEAQLARRRMALRLYDACLSGSWSIQVSCSPNWIASDTETRWTRQVAGAGNGCAFARRWAAANESVTSGPGAGARRFAPAFSLRRRPKVKAQSPRLQ